MCSSSTIWSIMSITTTARTLGGDEYIEVMPRESLVYWLMFRLGDRVHVGALRIMLIQPNPNIAGATTVLEYGRPLID